MVRRVWLILAAVLLMAPLAFSAGTQEPAARPAAAVPAEYQCGIDWRAYAGQELNVLFSRHPWQESIVPMIPEFEALTGIKVNLNVIPHDELIVKVPAAFSSGTFAWDVFMARYYDAPKYTMEKWTASIEGFLNDPKHTDRSWYRFDDYFPAAQAITTWGRYQDRLPITAEASILIYRKDIYEEMGIKVPTTFDELKAAVAKISASGKLHGITARGGPANWMPFYGMIRSHGGEWFTKDDVVKVNTPESVSAVRTLVELAKSAPPGIAQFGWDQINTAMMSGVAATFIDASVIYPRLMDPARSTVVGKIGAAPYPAGPGGRVSNAHFWSIAMAESSQKKPLAWMFMMWATSPPTQKQIAIKGILPPRASIWQDPDFTKAYAPDFIDAMNVTMKTAVSLPTGPKAGPVLMGLLDTLTRKLQEAILGEKDAQRAMDELAVEWNRIIHQ